MRFPTALRARINERSSGKAYRVISLNLVREGNDIVVSITDDGAGLRHEAIRRQAIDSGLLMPQQRCPTVVIQFVLEHGFQHQKRYTQISGRGSGWTWSSRKVRILGIADIDSTRGEGTSLLFVCR